MGFFFCYRYGTNAGRIIKLVIWEYGKTDSPTSQCIARYGNGWWCIFIYASSIPLKVWATEGYEPNVSIAKKRLEPLGVQVITFEEDAHLPVENRQFDLILNKHESYDPAELR